MENTNGITAQDEITNEMVLLPVWMCNEILKTPMISKVLKDKLLMQLN